MEGRRARPQAELGPVEGGRRSKRREGEGARLQARPGEFARFDKLFLKWFSAKCTMFSKYNSVNSLL